MKPEDFHQRQLALDPEQSFICEAPAGSGKTELLTQRYLNLLTCVDSPEEIIAITFTRKAAGEMRARIVASLQRGMDEATPESEHQLLTWQLARNVLERDAARDWQIIENPNRLQVQTFDSLCARLANHLPLHSSFGAPPGVHENAEEYYVAASQHLLQTLEQDVPWSHALGQLLQRLDNNMQRLQQLFVTMLSKRAEWLPLLGAGGDTQDIIEVLESSLQQVRHDTVAKIKQLISLDQQKQLVELSAFAASQIRRAGKSAPILHCLDIDLHTDELPGSNDKGILQWYGLAHLLLKNDGDWRKALNRRNGFPRGENAQEKHHFQQRKQQCLHLIEQLKETQGLQELLVDLRALPRSHFNEDQLVLLKALWQLLPVLSAHLALIFRENNRVDFSEISMRAQQALGAVQDEVSDLALKLDYQIQHILVDEFQDTSPSQVNLISSLVQGWEPGDGRTLFCVGDAMQSIYGFRGANVGLFIHCIEHGLGQIPLTPLRLTTNFRSQAGVVNWVNQVFSKAFPIRSDISDGAVSYSHSIAFQEKLEGRAVWSHAFGDGKSVDDEARVILGIVRKTWLDNPAASIAILVRNRTHAAHITPLFRESGIKFRAVEMEALQDNIVIQDLMALTHALLDPADRISWLSILRAPWCGLSLVDLEAIANFNDVEGKSLTVLQQLEAIHQLHFKSPTQQPIKQNVVQATPGQGDMFSTVMAKTVDTSQRQLTSDGQLRIKRVAPVLFEAHQQRQRKSLRQWVEGSWIRLGGPACLSSEADLKNAELFFNLLENLDSQTILKKKHALKEAVTRLFAVPDPASSEQLQIMTIHKSKGLEFDTVIIPSLHRSPRRQDPELLRWYERISMDGEKQLLMAPITGSGKEKDPTYRHLSEQEKKKTQHENCRLLYVACTRARQRLHLLAQVKASSDNVHLFRRPAKSSLLHSVWQPLQTRSKLYQDSASQAKPAKEHSAEDARPKYLQRLPAQWKFPSLPEKHTLDSYVPFYEHEHDDQQVELQVEDSRARVVGTLIHRVIQQMGQQQFTLSKLQQYKSVWRSKLISMGIPLPQLEDALADVSTAVSKMLEDKKMHWLLSPERSERHHELALSMRGRAKGDASLRHLVIDLLVRDDNTIWIVDFKTSQPNEGQELSDFLMQEKQQYAPAMSRYKRAVEVLHESNSKSSDVKLALYFPLIGEFCPYESL